MIGSYNGSHLTKFQMKKILHMQLIYKIEFNTTNQYFKHIIEDLIKEAKSKCYL